MTTIDTIVIGSSAGGVEALQNMFDLLTPDLPASICLVNHVPQTFRSHLPEILGRTGFPAVHAKNGQETKPGKIYVAPPGKHLVVGPQTLSLVRGPKVNGSRPAIDRLFTSAAESRGDRVVSILLSGMLDDGSCGSEAVRCAGGKALALDPNLAKFGDMPRNAIDLGAIDFVGSFEDIASYLDKFIGQPATGKSSCADLPVPVREGRTSWRGLRQGMALGSPLVARVASYFGKSPQPD
jgi:two-component system chemotaxis response regulator CheB